jgi:transcriptional regulator with XRE-family HTH domain
MTQRGEGRVTGEDLRRLRRRLRLTQREMAAELAVHENTYSRQERGEIGIGRAVAKLARLLEASAPRSRARRSKIRRRMKAS